MWHQASRRLGLLVVATTASGCASPGMAGSGPHRQLINSSDGGGSPFYSLGIRTDNLVFVSGVVGGSESGDIQEATRNALDGTRERVEASGATMADVVQCTVFLTDILQYTEMNEAYHQYFPSDPPARTAIAVEAVPASGQLEIACIAAIP